MILSPSNEYSEDRKKKELDDLYRSCLEKQAEMKKKLSSCSSKELLYQAIIDLGRTQTILSDKYKIDENLVPGCQSRMYLVAELKDGKACFMTEADALISAGLGQLLIHIYDKEVPEVVLGCPPIYIQELGIPSSLTPGRANGLASLYHRMKQHALRWIVEKRG